MIKFIALSVLLMAFFSCNQTKQQFLSADQREWLREEAKHQLSGCQITAHDGTILYTPDGEGNYAALWTRDFGYMVENAIELMPPKHVKSALLYL